MPDFYDFYINVVGLQNAKITGSQISSLCPVKEHSKKNRCFSANTDTSQCKCHKGCFSGNAYMLAEHLNIDNPSQWLTNREHKLMEYKLVNTKDNSTEVKRERVCEINAIKNKQKEYTANLPKMLKDIIQPEYHKYVGWHNGNFTWHYHTGIKYHKPCYWDVDSVDKSCQIFREEIVLNWDKDSMKPLYICEGEKDALFTPHPENTITFSAGAGKVPGDFSSLSGIKWFMLIPDNDDVGYKGMEIVAKHLKTEFPDSLVEIAQWDVTLPKGYDTCDEWKKSYNSNGDDYDFSEYYNALTNRRVYELPKQGYEVMTLNSIKMNYTAPPLAIVENILVEKGISLIAGTDGVGKTWFVLQMAICIALGKDFLGFKIRQRPVLVFQFELSPEQLGQRLRKLDTDCIPSDKLKFAIFSADDKIFDSAWVKIADTIDKEGLTSGVVFIDNLYTSTSADVSDNKHLKPLLQYLDTIKNQTNNAFVLVGHHNKYNESDEPLLNKSLITGGKTLTNYVSNVFQIGNSSMGADLRRGKITKTRDNYTDLENMPLRLEFNPDTCTFERQGIISNETLHCRPLAKRWEFIVLIKFSERSEMRDNPQFDRKTITLFMGGYFPADTPNNVNTKTTRWLNKMVDFGLVFNKRYNSYELNYDEIKNLDVE